MATVLGLSCAVLVRTSGTFGSPTFSELKLLQELTPDDEFEEFNATVYGGGGFEMTEPTIRKLSLELTVIHDASDTAADYLYDAHDAKTSLDIVHLNGPNVATTTGPRAQFKSLKRTPGKTKEGIVTYTYTLKPCLDLTNLPTTYTVPS